MLDWFKRLALLAAVSLLAACGGGDDDEATLVDIARSDPRFSTLFEAVAAADLGATLAAPGPYTLFAPTNDAFAALLSELGVSKAQLLADKPLLTAVLSYHLLPVRVERAAVPLGKPISTAQGGIFKIESVGGTLQITDGRNRKASITATDVSARNGLIHVIDKVLLPANKTLVETAVATPSFGILVEAVIAADLGATLSGSGPFTVFAPTDAAFAALLSELGMSKAQLLANKALLTQVLTYHVLPGRVLKADVPLGTPLSTVQGESLSIDASLAITDRNGRKAAIVATDVLASNGVIHVIDKVILPKIPSIVEAALATPDFSILAEAVVAADLAGALSAPGSFTVFAPTNAAFAALLAELNISKAALLADKALLSKVLSYHVLPGRVYAAGVPLNTPISTLQGGSFSVDAMLKISDANGRVAGISATDTLALNGVIHTLDRVLLPAP